MREKFSMKHGLDDVDYCICAWDGGAFYMMKDGSHRYVEQPKRQSIEEESNTMKRKQPLSKVEETSTTSIEDLNRNAIVRLPLALGWVEIELTKAFQTYAPFNSRHEGFAILLEEVDELKHEIWTNGSPEALRREALQVAAMAVRFLLECK